MMKTTAKATPYVDGQVVGGMLNAFNNRVAMGCKHRKPSTACGGCYARLHFAIEAALEMLDNGRADEARARLELTRTQRMADPKGVRR